MSARSDADADTNPSTEPSASTPASPTAPETLPELAAQKLHTTLGDVPWEQLSPKGRWRALKIALPHSFGLSYLALSRTLGVTEDWIARQMRLLRREIADLTEE